MHKGYLAIAFYIVHIRSSISDTNECDYFCDADGCGTSKSNNVSTIEFCGKEYIPKNVNLTLVYQNETNFHGELQINFLPPKGVCKYEVTLLANNSINEERCTCDNFQNLKDIKVHTKNTICFISNNNEYQPSVTIPFQYIFTACYTIQIYFGNGSVQRSCKFLKTNYNRTEVMIPTLKCVYDILPGSTKEYKELNFEIDFSMPTPTNAMLRLGSVYDNEGDKSFDILSEHFLNNTWSFYISEEYIQNNRDNSNTSLITSGEYEKKMNFTIEALQDRNYGILIRLFDIRCIEKTLWKPPMGGYSPCVWFKECQYIPTHFGIETSNNTSFYLFLSIAIIISSMFVMLGIMYFTCVVYTCNTQENKFYINDSKRNNQKIYNKMNVCALKDKEKPLCENISDTSTDIVLLYPKISESFIALMADFREILSTACQCVVYDWYDGVQWNHVAEIGGSDWFAEMLNKGSRVIWIDTPAIRSSIKRRFQKDFFVKSSEQYNYIEINDFRDIAYPMIFTSAKHNVGVSMIQQHKHFIVRLKGFENFENEDDPFVDLSPHKRYLVPRDLSLLCSDLSILKLDRSLMSREEDLIKQHLHRVKSDFRE